MMFSRTSRPSLGHRNHTSHDRHPNDVLHRTRADSRLPDPDPMRHLQAQADSSSDDDIPVSNPNRPSNHSRSMSHPFPSLFSSKKKNARPDSPPGNEAPGGGDTKSKSHVNPQQNTSVRRPQRGPADFATGNCMTCASLVRWPKDLQIFRCTICLTINDLTPYNPAGSHTSFPSADRRSSPIDLDVPAPQAQSHQPPYSISLGYTANLTRTCLRASLQHWVASRGSRRHYSQTNSTTPGTQNRHALSQRSRVKLEASPSSNPSPPSFVYDAVFDDSSDPQLELFPAPDGGNASRSYSASNSGEGSSTLPLKSQPSGDNHCQESLISRVDTKKMFRKLEDYLVACFSAQSCINMSFNVRRTSVSSKHAPATIRRQDTDAKREPVYDDTPISELDPKMLLLGDFAENGFWWTRGQDDVSSSKAPPKQQDEQPSIVNSRSPRVDWGETLEWYNAVNNAAESWVDIYNDLLKDEPGLRLSDADLERFEKFALDAQDHLRRALLKCTEMLLKRPGRLMSEPQDTRFLLILLANPILSPGHKGFTGYFQHSDLSQGKSPDRSLNTKHPTGRHSGIIKRILGLLANSSEPCHRHLITWLSRLPEHLFLQTKELVGSFITYRLTRQNDKKVEQRVDVTAGLIPQMPHGRTSNSTATLHAVLEASKTSKKTKQPVEPKRAAYTDDWQIKAGARVMALLFAANNLMQVRHSERHNERRQRPLVSTSDWYNSLVDCLDFKADFELWEAKRGRFTFCQYPFFLSIWAKIQILEFDAKRQMEGKAREAFFDSIMTHRNYAQYLTLSIRRECLVDDSLNKVSEVVGSGSDDIKKALRIEFQGEEGVDGGGLRKEWFLLLVREVFNPDHGLFVYDDDSQFCYFNPNTFETSDQYFLVGVVLGLAIYNSTILDVALPPFAFRKLLASAPIPATGSPAHPRPPFNYTLDDLAEYRPALARGLRQLLDFDGDVQSTFCLDFAIETERYGVRARVPLCSGGESKMVTSANRREYVDLYVRYLLDTSVTRQFEPFKRGFFTVCAGNALTLFRPEEIELLIRGSDEPLDIASLKAVAVYQNWPKESTPEKEPTIRWFWDTFERASPQEQRHLLSFITGSDRIPAMGAASLVIRVSCLGEDEGRFPSARTCFNVLSLYRYRTRARLEECLWRAVNESEGFGLK